MTKNYLAAVSCLLTSALSAFSQTPFTGFAPGNVVISRSVYTGTASTVTIGQQLPPVCPATAVCTSKATDNGAYPAIGSSNNVWNNNKADSSFGITSPLFLDQLTPGGVLVNTYAVPSNVVSTSFPSKSEVGLNLSTDGFYLTFMAYSATPNTIDVSNSNTPGVYDPTNPAGGSYYRSVVQVDAAGGLGVTATNAYSGNNGRAAVLANGLYYMVGNSNNGTGTPANVIAATGVQVATPGQASTTVPTQVGNFSIAQLVNPATGTNYAADKLGKDNNFRGLTVFNNTLYVTKGSGSNGVNTVYQVGNKGSLPTLANAASTPITILPGFPTTLAKNADAQFPFGIWFANASTLYVADEGDGTAANAGTSTTSGLQKWVLTNGTWQRVYVMQNGLSLGQPYSVANYPAALNPATDGLRNITGRVNANGTVTIWAVTSTVSANGDQGADPNKVVSITDILANTNPAVAGSEVFTTVKSAAAGEILRGVSLTPGSVQAAPSGTVVVSAANAGISTVAPDSLATVFGSNLATTTGGLILPNPFPGSGTSVSITDASGKTLQATLASFSPTQVSFVVPAGTAAGAAQVTVTSGDGTKSTAAVQVATVAPGIFTLNGAGLAGADVYRYSKGLQTLEQIYGIDGVTGALVPNPVKIGGDLIYLALFGTGLRGAAKGTVTVTIDGASVPVLYSGAAGSANLQGLDQINFQLPASLTGRGTVTILVTAGGVAANPVQIVVQ